MLLAVDTGLDLTVLGPLHPFLEHAKPVASVVLPLLDAEACSYSISAAVSREALLCITALFTRFPISAIDLSSEVINSLIARVTDIAISGKGSDVIMNNMYTLQLCDANFFHIGTRALSAQEARTSSVELYIPLPARKRSGGIGIDGHSHGHVDHNDSEQGADSGGCCGGSSHSHGGGGGGCCSSGSISHTHDHSSDSHGDTLWDRRVLQMHEQERQRASIAICTDKSSRHLSEAAIGLLTRFARHVVSSSDGIMSSLTLCCIQPVSSMLSSTTLEASLNVLSAIGGAVSSIEVYGLCLEPIIKAISPSGARGDSIDANLFLFLFCF
jgi:hypothetical protein